MLRIVEMKKDGYQISLADQSSRFYPFYRKQMKEQWGDCKKENPCVFNAWKYPDGYGENVKLINKKFHGLIQSNGSKRSLDLFRFGDTKFTDVLSRGQIFFSYFRDNGDKNSSWRLQVELKEGGLIEANQIYTNEAPEKGYKSSLTITDRDIEGKPWFLRKKFFFYLKERKKYGCLVLELELISRNNKSKIRGYYTINPNGTQILKTFENVTQFNQ